MLKIKEEFDYKSLSRRLEIQLDKQIAEHERQQKGFQDEIERIAQEAQIRITEAEKGYAEALEVGTCFVKYVIISESYITCLFMLSSFSLYIMLHIIYCFRP